MAHREQLAGEVVDAAGIFDFMTGGMLSTAGTAVNSTLQRAGYDPTFNLADIEVQAWKQAPGQFVGHMAPAAGSALGPAITAAVGQAVGDTTTQLVQRTAQVAEPIMPFATAASSAVKFDGSINLGGEAINYAGGGGVAATPGNNSFITGALAAAQTLANGDGGIQGVFKDAYLDAVLPQGDAVASVFKLIAEAANFRAAMGEREGFEVALDRSEIDDMWRATGGLKSSVVSTWRENNPIEGVTPGGGLANVIAQLDRNGGMTRATPGASLFGDTPPEVKDKLDRGLAPGATFLSEGVVWEAFVALTFGARPQ